MRTHIHTFIGVMAVDPTSQKDRLAYGKKQAHTVYLRNVPDRTNPVRVLFTPDLIRVWRLGSKIKISGAFKSDTDQRRVLVPIEIERID